ncbi:MAG: hypothetical protein HEQ27_03185 [Dolichospermum sp. JUN01]|nr:hypothetical protein [Dolichospermum sp. JUN01]
MGVRSHRVRSQEKEEEGRRRRKKKKEEEEGRRRRKKKKEERKIFFLPSSFLISFSLTDRSPTSDPIGQRGMNGA